MRRAHLVADVRTAEAALAGMLPSGTLMQRAAAGLARYCGRLLHRTYGARVVLLVGPGDNGGDALYAGARLAGRGVRVIAVPLVADSMHTGGLAALRAAGGRLAPDARALLASADLVLDGLVGIGGRPGLSGAAAQLSTDLAGLSAPVVAVDLPSGIDPDTGETPGPHVRASSTVTFGTHKVGLLADPGAGAAGTVHLVDIGLAAHLPARAEVEALEDVDVRRLLPRPGREAHKYSRGVVGVLAGSAAYTGAAVLATGGAVHGGAGMVRFLPPSPPGALEGLIREHWPEVVVDDGRVQAWAIGSGIGSDPARAEQAARLLSGGDPLVADADALRLLPQRLPGPAVLTPHAGELARMLGVERAAVEAQPLLHARTAAARWQATVLLKGPVALVVDPDGRARANPTGTPWLATAGSGDVMAGLAAALLATGLSPVDAASVAAYVHGVAGSLAARRAGAPSAQNVLAVLPEALLALRG